MSAKPLFMTTLLPAGLMLAICATTEAEMIILSSARSISTGGTQRETMFESATESLPFVDDILDSGYVRDDNEAIVGSVSVSASQSSTLTSSRIRGVGRGSGFASGPAESNGRSEMVVEFVVEESTRFTLAGELRLTPHGLDLNGSSAFIRLTGPEGVAVEINMDQAHPPDQAGIVDFLGKNRVVGELPAGNYTLQAVSLGRGSNGLTRCADYDFTLTANDAFIIPEPASNGMLLVGLACCLLGRRRP